MEPTILTTCSGKAERDKMEDDPSTTCPYQSLLPDDVNIFKINPEHSPTFVWLIWSTKHYSNNSSKAVAWFPNHPDTPKHRSTSPPGSRKWIAEGLFLYIMPPPSSLSSQKDSRSTQKWWSNTSFTIEDAIRSTEQKNIFPITFVLQNKSPPGRTFKF